MPSLKHSSAPSGVPSNIPSLMPSLDVSPDGKARVQWDYMSDGQRTAAEYFVYDETHWNGNCIIELYSTIWNKMKSDDKDNLCKLSIDEEEWDGEFSGHYYNVD